MVSSLVLGVFLCVCGAWVVVVVVGGYKWVLSQLGGIVFTYADSEQLCLQPHRVDRAGQYRPVQFRC